MPARDQVPVPAQHRVRAYEQPQSPHCLPRQAVQQRGQQRPVCRGEVHSLLAELTFQNHDLMPPGEDLHIFVPVALRQ
jgi:hypothetical protein